MSSGMKFKDCSLSFPDAQYTSCTACGMRFEDFSPYDGSCMKTNKRQLCSLCDVNCKEHPFLERSTDEVLEQANNSEEQLLYQCGICCVKFAQPTSLEVHMKVHIKEEEPDTHHVPIQQTVGKRPHQEDPLSGTMMSELSGVILHQMLFPGHKKAGPRTGELGEALSDIHNLLPLHLSKIIIPRLTARPEIDVHTCAHCYMVFTQLRYLKRHIESVHGETYFRRLAGSLEEPDHCTPSCSSTAIEQLKQMCSGDSLVGIKHNASEERNMAICEVEKKENLNLSINENVICDLERDQKHTSEDLEGLEFSGERGGKQNKGILQKSAVTGLGTSSGQFNAANMQLNGCRDTENLPTCTGEIMNTGHIHHRGRRKGLKCCSQMTKKCKVKR